MLIGAILLIGMVSFTYSNLYAEQDSEPANCIYDHDYKMCFDYEEFNCTCVDVGEG